MTKLKMYCMCLYNNHLNNVKKLNYLPVGLGTNKFNNEWIRDNIGDNISSKNKYYGEYTFYYWFWKNVLPTIDDGTWIGFCGYRYHWSNQNNKKSDEITKLVNNSNFQSFILQKIPIEWNKYNVILGEEFFVNKWKLMKIVKKGFRILLKYPFAFKKNNQNIKLHFDVFHGEGNLDKAIDLLDISEREDFRNFTRKKSSFNRENLFICKSKELVNSYFESIFPWLEKCEKVFGFDLQGYSETRIYAFLAERYLSYWFNKYSKPLVWPIFFFDTNKNNLQL